MALLLFLLQRGKGYSKSHVNTRGTATSGTPGTLYDIPKLTRNVNEAKIIT